MGISLFFRIMGIILRWGDKWINDVPSVFRIYIRCKVNKLTALQYITPKL